MSKENITVALEEKFAEAPIPQELRRHWKYPASIYMGMTAVIAACMAGGGLIYGLSFTQAVWAMILGLACLTFLFYTPLGKIGADQGLNTYLIGEAAFGSKGSNLATAFIITAIPCIAWYGIQVSIAAQAIAEAFGLGVTGTNVFMVIFGIIFAIPAMYGILGMAWLNYISIPLMLFIVIFGASKAIGVVGTEGVWAYQPEQNMGLMWGINMQIGMIAVGASFVADYTRWIKSKWSDITVSGIIGLFPFTILLTVSGMIMALSSTSLGVENPWNIAEVMAALGMPTFALILIFLLQWTTCITATYSSGLALKKVFGWSRFWWTLIAAILGIVLALSGIVNHFLGFVNILASWVTPAAGVLISEYFFVAKGRLNRKEGIYWPGIVSWLLGGLIAWKLKFFIPALNGLISSAVIYYVYHKLSVSSINEETSKGV